MNNRLPVLAHQCRQLQQEVIKGSLDTAEKTIALGKALIEAKHILRDGEWDKWLADNTSISTRTASNYMRIARSGLKSETVAELGLRGVLRSMSESKGKKPPNDSADRCLLKREYLDSEIKAQFDELMAAWRGAGPRAREIALIRARGFTTDRIT
ncbi:MAG: DUF3102 domain-containing protein [Methylocystis sp.]